MPTPVVFLDKDGTLVEDAPYGADPGAMRLLPGAGEALRRLHAAGWRLAVVTNQSGVARGLFPESALAGVESRLRELLAEHDVPLAVFSYCPHHPEGVVPRYAVACECRKPAPGLIAAAARELSVDPRDCWMVGDRGSDVEAGKRAGCRTLLLAGAGHDPWDRGPAGPDAVAADWAGVASAILAAGQPGREGTPAGRAPTPNPNVVAAVALPITPPPAYEAAVVIPTVGRHTLERAVRSVFAQDLPASVQILIGVDGWPGDRDRLAALAAEAPANRAVLVFDPGYSTSARRGGFAPAATGGALRTILSYAAHSRHVAYLDDDNWWAPGHLGSMLKAVAGNDWAYSRRLFADPDTGNPLCEDTWESVGPGAGVYAEAFGGFVDPNCLLLDKVACEPALRLWCQALPGDASGMSSDRPVFSYLSSKRRGVGTGSASVYYTLNATDVNHAIRMRWIAEAAGGKTPPGARRAGGARPKVHVLLLDYNHPERVEERWRQFLLPALEGVSHAVTCVDNSPARSERLAALFGPDYLWMGGCNIDYAPAINLAAFRRDADYLVVCGTRRRWRMFDASWVRDLVAPMERDPAVVLTGTLAPCHRPNHFGAGHLFSFPGDPPPHVQGGVFAARVSFLREHPYPPEWPRLYSDHVITWTALRHGYKVANVPTHRSVWRVPVGDVAGLRFVYDCPEEFLGD